MAEARFTKAGKAAEGRRERENGEVEGDRPCGGVGTKRKEIMAEV